MERVGLHDEKDAGGGAVRERKEIVWDLVWISRFFFSGEKKKRRKKKSREEEKGEAI